MVLRKVAASNVGFSSKRRPALRGDTGIRAVGRSGAVERPVGSPKKPTSMIAAVHVSSFVIASTGRLAVGSLARALGRPGEGQASRCTCLAVDPCGCLSQFGHADHDGAAAV